MLGDPPVVLLLEVADSDQASAGTYGELSLGGRPADEGGGAVDAEQDEGGLPTGWRGLPDIGISI